MFIKLMFIKNYYNYTLNINSLKMLQKLFNIQNEEHTD